MLFYTKYLATNRHFDMNYTNNHNNYTNNEWRPHASHVPNKQHRCLLISFCVYFYFSIFGLD